MGDGQRFESCERLCGLAAVLSPVAPGITRMARLVFPLAFCAGAVLGLALAVNAGLILALIDDRLLWSIPIAGALGLVALTAYHLGRTHG